MTGGAAAPAPPGAGATARGYVVGGAVADS